MIPSANMAPKQSLIMMASNQISELAVILAQSESKKGKNLEDTPNL
jgi:hypothetical protein